MSNGPQHLPSAAAEPTAVSSSVRSGCIRVTSPSTNYSSFPFKRLVVSCGKSFAKGDVFYWEKSLQMPVRVKADVALSRSVLGPSHVLLANKTQPELFIVKALFHVGSPIWEVSVAAYYGTSYGCIWISWYNGCFMKWHQPKLCTNGDTGWCWTLSLHLRGKCLRSERQKNVVAHLTELTFIFNPWKEVGEISLKLRIWWWVKISNTTFAAWCWIKCG